MNSTRPRLSQPRKLPACLEWHIAWTVHVVSRSSGGGCQNMTTGLPIFPMKTSPPPRDTHLPWTKKVMFKTTKRGNIGTPALRELQIQTALSYVLFLFVLLPRAPNHQLVCCGFVLLPPSWVVVEKPKVSKHQFEGAPKKRHTQLTPSTVRLLIFRCLSPLG